MTVVIRHKVIVKPIRDLNIHWRKKRLLLEGVRIAYSHVQCPICKTHLRTSKDIFQCRGHGTYKTAEHLATITGTTQYDFANSIRPKGVPNRADEYLDRYHTRKTLVRIS